MGSRSLDGTDARHLSISAEIQAPPQRVWAVMSDFERWHEWTPTVRSIRRLGSGPLQVGSRLRIRQPKFPPADWRLTSFEPGSSFTWVTGGLGVLVTAHHRVEATAAGSRVTLSLQFSGWLGGLVARLTRNINDRYLGIEAAGLKRRSEEI